MRQPPDLTLLRAQVLALRRQTGMPRRVIARCLGLDDGKFLKIDQWDDYSDSVLCNIAEKVAQMQALAPHLMQRRKKPDWNL